MTHPTTDQCHREHKWFGCWSLRCNLGRRCKHLYVLTCPDGRRYEAERAVKCASLEQGDRIPPTVRLERIFAAIEDDDPLDTWEDMQSAPKDGTRILALVTEKQFYRDSETPNELIPVVVRWLGEHELWSMPGIGGLRPTLWQPINLGNRV